MATTSVMVSDMLMTVKSREVQRALFAEASGDREGARRHFLAAAHLEQVLAHDYDEAGEPELARRKPHQFGVVPVACRRKGPGTPGTGGASGA